MRAQLQTLTSGYLSVDKVSLTPAITYYNDSESCSGFPGGKTFCHYTNSTLERATVQFSQATYSHRVGELM